MNEHWTNSGDGCRLFTEIQGAGHPLLLVGGMRSDTGSWARHMALLSAGHRCISYDRRGVGRSDKPDAMYRHRDHLRDLSAVIDSHDGGQPVDLVAHSIGGLTALGYAHAHPDRVRRLCLINSAAHINHNLYLIVLATARALRQDEPAALEALNDIGLAISFGESMLRQLEPRREAIKARAFDTVTPTSARHLYDGLVADYPLDLRDRLGEIRHPCLILAGDEDLQFPAKHAKTTAEALPDATLEVWSDCGHMIPVEQAERLGRRLGEFLT